MASIRPQQQPPPPASSSSSTATAAALNSISGGGSKLKSFYDNSDTQPPAARTKTTAAQGGGELKGSWILNCLNAAHCCLSQIESVCQCAYELAAPHLPHQHIDEFVDSLQTGDVVLFAGPQTTDVKLVQCSWASHIGIIIRDPPKDILSHLSPEALQRALDAELQKNDMANFHKRIDSLQGVIQKRPRAETSELITKPVKREHVNAMDVVVEVSTPKSVTQRQTTLQLTWAGKEETKRQETMALEMPEITLATTVSAALNEATGGRAHDANANGIDDTIEAKYMDDGDGDDEESVLSNPPMTARKFVRCITDQADNFFMQEPDSVARAKGVYLFESALPCFDGRENGGVQVVPLRYKLDHYYPNAVVSSRRLLMGNKEITSEYRRRFNVIMERLARAWVQRPFNMDMIEFLKAGCDFCEDWCPQFRNQEELSSFFCSELVAECWQQMSVLDRIDRKESNEFHPSEWSAPCCLMCCEAGRRARTMRLSEPFSMTDEVMLYPSDVGHDSTLLPWNGAGCLPTWFTLAIGGLILVTLYFVDEEKSVNILKYGAIVGGVQFVTGAFASVVFPLVLPSLPRSYKRSTFRPYAEWTRNYMIVHPFLMGLIFAFVYISLKVAVDSWEYSPWARGALFGVGYWFAGSVPIFMLHYAAIRMSSIVTWAWIAHNLLQYITSGIVLALLMDS